MNDMRCITSSAPFQWGRSNATTSTPGNAARSAIERSDPDLVVLDVMLPGADGLELCRWIRSTSELPVIMLRHREQARLRCAQIRARRRPGSAVGAAQGRLRAGGQAAATGATASGLSLYDRLQKAEKSPMGIALDVAGIAASIIGAAGAVRALRTGSQALALAGTTGKFLLYSGFATNARQSLKLLVSQRSAT